MKRLWVRVLAMAAWFILGCGCFAWAAVGEPKVAPIGVVFWFWGTLLGMLKENR